MIPGSSSAPTRSTLRHSSAAGAHVFCNPPWRRSHAPNSMLQVVPDCKLEIYQLHTVWHAGSKLLLTHLGLVFGGVDVFCPRPPPTHGPTPGEFNQVAAPEPHLSPPHAPCAAASNDRPVARGTHQVPKGLSSQPQRGLSCPLPAGIFNEYHLAPCWSFSGACGMNKAVVCIQQHSKKTW